jgi:hypothetical protein
MQTVLIDNATTLEVRAHCPIGAFGLSPSR